jgi:hypothetical protein
MKSPSAPSKKLGALIDQIESIREDLLRVQRSMEILERANPAPSSRAPKKA